MSPGLRARLIAWYCGAVGAITAIPWVAAALYKADVPSEQVALVLLLLPLGQLIGAPAWSWTADRTDPLTVLRLATGGATVAGFGLAAAQTPLAMIAMLAVLAVFRAGVFPVADALTLGLLGTDRRGYGQIRAAGSVVFGIVIFADGEIREVWARGPLWIGAALMGVAAVMSWTLPPPAGKPSRPGLAELWTAAKDPLLGLLAVVALLHGMTLTTYDSLYTLHIESLGLSSRVAGASLAVGVAVEVAVLWAGRSLIGRLGLLPLLAIAVCSGVPRWLLTGTSTTPWVLILTQGLHGLGFGAYWVAGVALFNERAPASLASSAQALFTVTTFGVGYLASMTLASTILAGHDTSTLFAVLTGISALASVGVILAAIRYPIPPEAG